jgi:hypothetical protein
MKKKKQISKAELIRRIEKCKNPKLKIKLIALLHSM